MEHIYKDLFKVTTSVIDGYFTEEISSYNVVLKDYYDHYNTNEIILEWQSSIIFLFIFNKSVDINLLIW